MARLSAADRKAMPASEFAQPGKKAFPMNDRTHTALAIRGATRAFHAGNISQAEMEAIHAKAKAKLGRPIK